MVGPDDGSTPSSETTPPEPAGADDPASAANARTQLDDGKHELSAADEQVSGTVVAVIARPWARDAQGNPVRAFFTVAGTTLTLTVEHVADAGAYPVYAKRRVVDADCYGRVRGQDRNAQYPYPYPRRFEHRETLTWGDQHSPVNLPDCRLGGRRVRDKPTDSRHKFNADQAAANFSQPKTSSVEYDPNTRRWPLRDSFGDVFAWIGRSGDGTRWELYNEDNLVTPVATTIPGKVSTFDVGGRACMKTDTMEKQYALVLFSPGGGLSAEGRHMKTRGFIRRDALPKLKRGVDNDTLINSYYVGCGEGTSGYNMSPLDDAADPMRRPDFDRRDRYIGERSYFRKQNGRMVTNPKCNKLEPRGCGPYRNYEDELGAVRRAAYDIHGEHAFDCLVLGTY